MTEVGKKYKNIKSGNEAVVLNIEKGNIEVQYLKGKRKIQYRNKYFETTFNPVPETETN